MSRFIYRIAIGLYHFGILIASLFNPKAKAWFEGRKNNLSSLTNWRDQLPNDTPIIWMHCASLGEFEQGRPVLESIKKKHPTYKVVLTFYSPSGYEQRKNYSHANWVGYLPADGRKRADQWLKILKPSMAIFVKYEFWVEHLSALFSRQIPTFLIAASFRKDQLFFKWYGSFFRDTLNGFKQIFTQSQQDVDLLKSIDIKQAKVAGDPRIDRVLQIASSPKKFQFIKDFKNTENLLIAGSTWLPDENILLSNTSNWKKGWRLLLVPHEVNERHINQICQKITLPFIRYSKITNQSDLSSKRIIVVDQIGMLSQLYQYGDLAYIGGGFGVSIHNTLEPAAFHLPIIMGPKYHKFQEAVTLINQGGAFAISDINDFQSSFSKLTKNKNRKESSEIVKKYILKNKGATDLIIEGIS